MADKAQKPAPAPETDDEPVECASPPCLLHELDPNWLEAPTPKKPRRERD